MGEVVVPGYYLVWYNSKTIRRQDQGVVVPGYYLVWYNSLVINGKMMKS